MVVLLALLLSVRWLLVAILVRIDETIYMPQGVVYLGAASVLLLVPMVTTGRVPQISLRLLHAAITVAGLAYFLSPVMLEFALRVLPSAYVATVFATVPMWLLLIAHGMFRDKFNQYVLLFVGIAVFFFGIREEAELRGSTILAMGALFV